MKYVQRHLAAENGGGRSLARKCWGPGTFEIKQIVQA